ncbi:MAG: hypothetical protein ACLTDR_01035 [Adlercreutzia equolifaciens]
MARIHASSRHHGPGDGGGSIPPTTSRTGATASPAASPWWAATRTPPSRCPTATSLFTGGLGAHAGGEAMGCTVIPTSSGNTKRQVQMLKDCKTDILACTPSYAPLIADTAIRDGP